MIIISIHTVSQTDHQERMNQGKPGPFLTSQILTPVKKTQQLESASWVRFARALGPFAAFILLMAVFLGTNLFIHSFFHSTNMY